MFPFNKQIPAVAHSDTYPLGENPEHTSNEQLNALVALSHTVIEHRLYSAMLAEVLALCCADGLTNAQIGTKLRVSEQTIKFHLRNIFIKFGVKRRTELVSRLLSQGNTEAVKEKAGAMHGG